MMQYSKSDIVDEIENLIEDDGNGSHCPTVRAWLLKGQSMWDL